jgi:hypothetical protein
VDVLVGAVPGWMYTATPWSRPRGSLPTPADRDGVRGHRVQRTRTFATTTAGITALADWLAEHRVTRAGMESTGVYWNPVYYLLEDQLDVWLINASICTTWPAARPTSRTRRGSRRWSNTAWSGPASCPHRRSGSCAT